MKRHSQHRIWTFALAAMAFLLVSCSSQKGSDPEALVTAVNDIWARYASGLNSGDLDSWLSLWTDDGVQLPPGEPPVVGKDRIRTRNRAVLDKFAFNMSITNEEVGAAGDWAFARGSYTATLTAKDGSQTVPVDGKYMTILKRQPDGSWRIYRDIFNSNVTAP
jgi:uncharacterized protein (TIGR02246 family)